MADRKAELLVDDVISNRKSEFFKFLELAFFNISSQLAKLLVGREHGDTTLVQIETINKLNEGLLQDVLKVFSTG